MFVRGIINKVRHPSILLPLLVTAFLAVSTLITSNSLQSKKINNLNAAGKGSDVVFTVVDTKSLTTSQRSAYNKFANGNNVQSSKVLNVPDIKSIPNAVTITVPLFDEGLVTLRRESLTNARKNTKIWKSVVINNGISFSSYFITRNKQLLVKISTPKSSYEIRSIDSNNLALMQINYENNAPLEDDISVSNSNNPNTRSASVVSESKTIDVLMLYTSTLKDMFAPIDIELYILWMLEDVNQAFVNNNIIHKVKIVEMLEVPSEEGSSCGDTLNRLSTKNDGYFTIAHSEREKYDADVVGLFGNATSQGCGGMAYLYPSSELAFLYININAIEYAFAHELGHILGAHHDKSTDVNPLFSYGHGQVLPSLDATTIMAYPRQASCFYNLCGTRINYFSTPLQSYNGVPLGTTYESDNVRVINETAPIVAAFRGDSGGGGGSGGTKGCGESCSNASECQSGMQCIDVVFGEGHQGNECWNESACDTGVPDRNRRISGKVLDCNGNPKVGVKVASKDGNFNKTSTTNAQGIYYLEDVDDECSVDQDSGQAFYVVAGKDADSSQSDYYGKVDSPVFIQSAISCESNINCNYSGNQSAGGPTRKSYQLVVSAFASTPNVYNAYVCEAEPYWLSGFDFKQKNCPIACNATCTSDSQCTETNSNWYCASQLNDQSYQDNTSYISTISYKSGSDPTVKTETGPTTSINMQVVNGTMQQHLVKNGKLFYRENVPGSGWDSYWTDKTSDISSVGCNYYSGCGGTIVGFNSYILPNGTKEQNVLRKNNTSSKLFSRNNSSGWSSWVDSTSDVSSVDSGNNSGIVTSFTTYTHRDGYKLQTLVKGGKVYERNNLNGWSSWTNVTGMFNACTGNSSCGSGTITSIERSIQQDGSDMIHLFRNGKLFSRKSTLSNEACRLRSKPSSSTCS